MTNYTKTMREALESMYISEDNVGILRDIVKRKQAKPLKFADGKMKVDLFTASAVTRVLDKVNPANKAKITKLINTGKKANFMSVAKVVMKSENDPEIKEEVEIKERKRPKYTPLSKRQDRPDAILWLCKNASELTDGQISKLSGHN